MSFGSITLTAAPLVACERAVGEGKFRYRAWTGLNYEDAQFPFYNFTRDTKGTVAAAYVDPNTGQCSLDPSTGIPPWPTLYLFTSGPPGSQLTISGERYTPGDTIEVSFKDKSGVTTTYPPVTPGADRTLTIDITVPSTAAVGKGVITVASKQSGVKFVEAFLVT